MSKNLPIRAVRIPVLQRQCLFSPRRALIDRRPFSASTSRAISSTSPRCRGGGPQDRSMTKAAARQQMGPAPKVNMEMAQRETKGIAEDIGLLQDTIIRAPLGKLPMWWSPKFWGYFWNLLRSKGTAVYSRIAYKRMIQKKKWTRNLPADFLNHRQLRNITGKLYDQIYVAFAKGDVATIRRFCLPPLARDFTNRIAARGNLAMDWELIRINSARVMSHRVSPLGEDQPDTAYRQIVVRLNTKQKLSIKAADSPSAAQTTGRPRRGWTPPEARQSALNAAEGKKITQDFAENGVPKTVVEYVVLQRRVMSGVEDEQWKVWGFTEESTPEKIKEDEVYWSKTLDAQARAVA